MEAWKEELYSYYLPVGSIGSNYNELEHHGILGMKWGIRRYQNEDGSLTKAGKKRYDVGEPFEDIEARDSKKHNAASRVFGAAGGRLFNIASNSIKQTIREGSVKELMTKDGAKKALKGAAVAVGIGALPMAVSAILTAPIQVGREAAMRAIYEMNDSLTKEFSKHNSDVLSSLGLTSVKLGDSFSNAFKK